MIERNLLDQTKDLRPPQRMVQSNFGIAEQGLSQNNRVLELPNQGGGMPANPDGRVYAGGSPGLYAPGGKFSRGSGSMGMPANPYRDRMARLPEQFLNPSAQPQQGQMRPPAPMRPVPPDQMQDNNFSQTYRQDMMMPRLPDQPQPAQELPNQGGGLQNPVRGGGGRNPSQTYQNQENRSFSNSYGNSYNNSMSGYQPQYGSRGGFGMQQPRYGGGMGIMGLQSPFGGYGMQSPFGSYGGGMQQPMYGGMQQGYGMQQPQYQSSPFSPQFGGGIGSMSPGMGGGYGQPPQCGGGYGQQPPSYGGMGGGFNQRPMPIRQIEGPAMMQTQGPENLMRPQTPIIRQMTYGDEYGGSNQAYNTQRDYDQQLQTQPGPAMMLMPQMRTM